MHSKNNSVSPADPEAQLLRFLCADGEDLAQRRRVFQRLAQYSWRDNDHRILFEAIGELLAHNSREIILQLPAALTRRGFPDISCDALSAPSVLNSATVLALAEEILRASQ